MFNDLSIKHFILTNMCYSFTISDCCSFVPELNMIKPFLISVPQKAIRKWEPKKKINHTGVCHLILDVVLSEIRSKPGAGLPTLNR